MPTILVADDNSNIQKMVTLALKEQGIVVVAVSNGEAAVRKLPDLRPDLVLADIFMPVRNGYEVCEFVKRDERFAHIPVVLLVGAFDPLDEREVERVHADGVLKKPFVPPDPLIAMVKSLLERGPAPLVSGEAAAGSPMASAMIEPAAATRMEKTQQLTPAEIAAVTHQAAPELEPEQFALQPVPLAIDEAHPPVAFREMMGVEEEEEQEEAEEEAEAGAEAEEAEKEPAFEASSVSGFHFPGEIEVLPAGAKAEAPAAPSASAHGEAAQASPKAAPEAEDHWAGIKEEAKQPDPEQPPIHVEFAESAPVELITDETRDSMARIEVRPDPALVSSAHDWMSAPPAVAPPAPEREVAREPEPEFEPMRIEVESPAPIAHEAAHQFFVPPSRVDKSLETLAQDLHEEAVRATPPRRDAEETQQFMAPAARTPAAAPPDALPSASTWGRVEEVMLPAVPLIAGAAAEFHLHAKSAAPAFPEPEVVHEPAHFESAPPPAAAVSASSPGTGVGPDMLISAITQKVLEQLDPKMIEKLSRELVRPLIEALIRREIDKD